MSKARRTFEETLHDWRADPSNWQAGALFQPKGLGARLPDRHRRRTRVLTLALLALSTGAAAVAVAALARFLHLS